MVVVVVVMADGKFDTEPDGLLDNVARRGIVRVFEARAQCAVWLRFGEEDGREETADFGPCGCDTVAGTEGDGMCAPVEEAREPAFDFADGRRDEKRFGRAEYGRGVAR